MAKLAYDRYRQDTGLPEFEALLAEEQDVWAAVAETVRNAITFQPQPFNKEQQ
ncbi:hypothetical protein D3C80_2013160 [compost metagenome]